MNTHERIKLQNAMELIARNVNNESFLNGWLALGVADGDEAQADAYLKRNGFTISLY